MTGPLTHATHGDQGSRTTLVLLHGLTDSGGCWAGVVPTWTAAGHRVVTVDARGHGTSPRWTPDQLISPGDVMVDDVLSLLAALEPAGPVVLVGHSMGAAVAVATAAVGDPRAAQVVAVVAEDPPWPVPPRVGPDPLLAETFMTGWRADRSVSLSVRTARLAADNPGWPPAEIGPCARAKDDVQVDLLATGDIVPRRPWPDLVADLTAAGIPLLVVTGDRDVRVTAESESVALRAGARVVRVPGAGHCVRRDDTAGYLAAVEPFLHGVLG